jgi:predicted nucleic acid-binding protein
LPFCEVVETAEDIRGVCRDPWDDKFISCAAAAAADCIVTGDKDLLDIGCFRDIPVLSVADFLKIIMK